MRIYRPLSLIFAALFAATGLLFLAVPAKVISFFNWLASGPGWPQAPAADWSLYLILAAGYMYLVTALAVMMYKYPQNRQFAFLLAQAKTASSLLSLALFALQGHYLIYLANFLIDGFIALTVLYLYLKMGRPGWASS